ncbi:MAG: hydrogenase maturation nickel metallochaperone HypA [Candidatus Brocadiales bacterium]
MHDIESCRAILNIVDEESRKRDGKRVVRLKLSIGSLSGTNPEHLRDTLVFCSRGTVAEGAELELIKRPAKIRCLACDYVFETDTPGIPNCGRCRSSETRITDGDEVILESLEIETD